MRIALIADSHFDAGSRFDECVRVHDWIADDVAARGVDLVLHAGDIYERKSTPDERRAVATWVQRVTEVAPLVIVRGNHDAPRDIELLARLETRHPVVVEEGAGVHCVAGVVIGCMAWPTKASVLAMASSTSRQEGELAAGDALRAVLLGLGQQMDEVRAARGMGHAPKILLAHAMVRGSHTSTGQPLVGCDLELGLEDLALARADFYALGHIHMPQEWQIGDDEECALCEQESELEPGTSTPHEHARAANVAYPGSPRRTAFGEVEQKGYVVAEFESGLLVSWTRVPTPCTPMVHVHAEWAWENWNDDPNFRPFLVFEAGAFDAVPGAEVRVRYLVEADRRAEAKAAAEVLRADLLELGAVHVKIEEEVQPVGTARAPEVAQATTLAEKLAALWRARQSTPEPPRDERLIAMAQELKDAV